MHNNRRTSCKILTQDGHPSTTSGSGKVPRMPLPDSLALRWAGAPATSACDVALCLEAAADSTPASAFGLGLPELPSVAEEEELPSVAEEPLA